jgi:hypothetical protein
VVFTQTSKGNQNEIANAREEAKHFLEQNTREIAAALGLNPDLSIYLVLPKPEDVFEEHAFQSLGDKISSFNTEGTLAAYNVGHGLAYLELESGYAKATGNQESFATQVFPLYRDLISRNLKTLGVANDPVLFEFNNIDSVNSKLHDLRNKYDVELGGGQ